MLQDPQSQPWFNGRCASIVAAQTAKATGDPPHMNKVHSYRGIPDEVDERIKTIAKELKVPVGEIVRVLLEYALNAYNMGELLLNPQPRIVRSERNNTLFPE